MTEELGCREKKILGTAKHCLEITVQLLINNTVIFCNSVLPSWAAKDAHTCGATPFIYLHLVIQASPAVHTGFTPNTVCFAED